MFKNILVPTDGSALSRKAIKQAVRFAMEQNARVTGLHVSAAYKPDVREEFSVHHFVSPQEYAARAKAVAGRHLEVIERAAKAAGVRCQTVHAASDYPHDEILRTAEQKKCDLIYMASHGRRGIARLLLGSQTNKVLALAKMPVLVCR
jgi:nucleotide-binding universal stress UspA family protein